MQLNMTLIIQGIHFFVAYIFLKEFLLKLTLNIIEIERYQHRMLTDSIEARSIIIQQKELQQQEQWKQYQQEFALLIPKDIGSVSLISRPSISFPAFSYIEPGKHPLLEQVRNEFMKKVEHVF